MKREMQLIRLDEDMKQKIQAMKAESGFKFSKWVRAKFYEEFGAFKSLKDSMEPEEYNFLKDVPNRLTQGYKISALQAFYNNKFKKEMRLNYFNQLVERVALEAVK